jgi:hypothetical protein
MSTLKADAVTSAQDNTALTLSGRGTGGVKVNDYLIQTKGSDISSATSLTLGKDGNQFDVTGTTTITSIATQGVGSHVTLHFDGALTFTHHSTDLILPGAASITTAAGDIAVMYEYASADWRCVSYTKASGAAVVAAGGAWNLIGTDTAPGGSGTATLDVTGLDSTYDTYAIGLSDLVPISEPVDAWLRFGDSSGVDAGASDYAFAVTGSTAANATWAGEGTRDDAEAQIEISNQVGDDIGKEAGEGFGAMLYLHRPGDGTTFTNVSGTCAYMSTNPFQGVYIVGGARIGTVIVLDRVQFLFSSGNVETGRMTVWGIAHA